MYIKNCDICCGEAYCISLKEIMSVFCNGTYSNQIALPSKNKYISNSSIIVLSQFPLKKKKKTKVSKVFRTTNYSVRYPCGAYPT